MSSSRCEPLHGRKDDVHQDSLPTVEKARKGYEEGNTDLCGLASETDSYTGECSFSVSRVSVACWAWRGSRPSRGPALVAARGRGAERGWGKMGSLCCESSPVIHRRVRAVDRCPWQLGLALHPAPGKWEIRSR